MKKITLFLLVVLYLHNQTLAQSLQIIYETRVVLPHEIKQLLSFEDLAKINTRPLRKSFLYHKDGKSSYRIQTDTLFSTQYEEDIGDIPMYERAVFKDLFDETLTFIDMLNDSTTAAIVPLPSTVDWYLTGERKEILGYECHHVQKRNKYGVMQNVWYTKAIPVFDGPEDICNFPGLVLEFERGGKTFRAIEITQHQKKNYSVIPPPIQKIIDYIEFENRLKGQMRF